MAKTLYCPKCPFLIPLNEGSVLLKEGINCPECGEKLLIKKERVRGTTRPHKSPSRLINPFFTPKDPLYKISQVSSITGISSPTIRFWQTTFSKFFNVERTQGNQRLFSCREIKLIEKIRDLTSAECLTLKGVHKKLEAELKISETEPSSQTDN